MVRRTNTNVAHWIALTTCIAVVAIGGEARAQDTPVNFKVAFIADQGSGSGAIAVLNLISSEGADVVVHSGDFDYGNNPQVWDNMISSVLGPCFPYFASVGNHDDGSVWPNYQAKMMARMNCASIPWTGDLGVASTINYQGLFFVQTAPGLFGSGNSVYAPYIRDQLAADNSIWSICNWHVNQTLMQTGLKGNQAGWGVYEESRIGGAIVATGHEHAYSRTHPLSSIDNQVIDTIANTFSIAEGVTFVFVSGIGGRSIRNQDRNDPWWASIYTTDQNAAFGALFGEFNYNGDPCLAHFYFKDINGFVPDEFFVISTLGNCGGAGPFCGDGFVDPGENCSTCPADVPCPPGESCVDSVCVPASGGGCWTSNGAAWQNFSMPSQTGTFTVQFDAIPNNSNMDGVTTVSLGAGSTYDDYAVLIRFNPSGLIDARNGAGYAADVAVPYSAGASYHFLAEINVTTHTYSVWVNGTLFASNFAFRTTQSNVPSLNNWGIYNETGSHTVCNFVVGGGSVCGNGSVDPGEDCSSCPQDVQCPPGETCVGGVCAEPPPAVCASDIDGDGLVGVTDLLAVLAAWGTCPQ